MCTATAVAYHKTKMQPTLPYVSAERLRPELRSALLCVAIGLYYETVTGNPVDQIALASQDKAPDISEHIADMLYDQSTLGLVVPALAYIVENDEYDLVNLAVDAYLKIREID